MSVSLLGARRRHWLRAAVALLWVGWMGCDRVAKPNPAAATSVAEQVVGPKLQLAPARHDFGEVTQGEPLRCGLVVGNSGSQLLVIDRVAKGYTCSAAIEPPLIQPGESGRLQLSCDTNKLTGMLRDRLIIHSNDRSSPKHEVTVEATVLPLLAFDTTMLELQIPFGEQRSQLVRLTGKRAAEARLTVAETGNAGLVVAVVAAEEGRPQGLRVSLRGKQVGTHVGRILVATGLAQPGQLALPYACKVAGNLKLSPTRPYFNLRERGAKVRIIEVKSTRPDFQLREADVVEGPFVAGLQESERGGTHRVKVTVVERGLEDGARSARGKLLLVSNDPAEPELEVPLFALGTLNRAER